MILESWRWLFGHSMGPKIRRQSRIYGEGERIIRRNGEENCRLRALIIVKMSFFCFLNHQLQCVLHCTIAAHSETSLLSYSIVD